jgi:uncharacterized protein (DUF1697 family)
LSETLTTYVAFLRAINVAGHAVVKMVNVKGAFEAAGCKNVRTYIQSGNVIFDCASDKSTLLFVNIRTKLQKLIGSDPVIMFRTLSDLQAIVKYDPFKSVQNEALIKLYVAFLAEKPRVKPKLPLISSKEALEALAVKNLEVFILSRRKPNGFFGFPNNFIEQELGVLATSRNWSTVTKVLNFARQPERQVAD